VSQLVSIFAYLSVLARGATLALQTILVGGVSYELFVLRPALRALPEEHAFLKNKIQHCLFWAAVALIVVQILWIASNSAILMDTADLPFRNVVGAQFFLAALAMVCASTLLVCLIRFRHKIWAAVLCVCLIVAASVASSHAWSRIDNRFLLCLLDFVHQGAAGVWIGGLPFLLISLRGSRNPEAATLISTRFSRLAVVGVTSILVAGVGLSLFYIDSLNAMFGTAYGIMVLSKIALFLALVGIGALNKSIVARLKSETSRLLSLLRRNLEAEIAIGFTVLLAAVSLTSQPPAIDLANDRLSLQEVAGQFVPKWPRLSSPDVSQLATPTRQLARQEAERKGRPTSYVPGSSPSRPETPEGKAWSEYNHNWAGLVVLAIGVFAVASRFRGLSLARHWPLLFLGLAVFIFLRADPENWPLGPNGFWESWLEADVLQHRVFVLLIIAFAIFEWRVQTGRSHSPGQALVFPAVCALGGAALFTHSHSLGNIKDETLIECSHVLLAFLAVLAGCSRWTEVRSNSEDRGVFARLWPVCFVMIGTVLVLYRES
jgi:putative copper resistance protein D